jgi:CYTH domain-containing protein
MTTKLEIERKFLVKLPLSEEAEKALLDYPPNNITQVYLIGKHAGDVERVRSSSIKCLGATFSHFTHTRKTFISSGTNEETEIDVDEKRYKREVAKHSDPEKNSIVKVRHFVEWKGRLFELDIFEGAHKGLAVLEIELKDINEDVELPPFLEIIREVTDEKEFSNFNLASKK